jgi:hypothetical protein
MNTIADWHAQALDATGRVVSAIPPDRWRAATPCSDWDVRGLVNLVEACREVTEPQIDMLRASGAFAEGVPVARDASAQVRLLAMLGRMG